VTRPESPSTGDSERQMTAEIEIAGQFGGCAADDAVVPVFMRAMKPAGARVPIHSLDSRIERLVFILRVSGEIVVFEGQPVENVKFPRGRACVSLDILLWERDWEGKSNREIAAVLARRVRAVPAVLEPLMRKRKLAIDTAMLSDELDRFAAGFQELAETL
jgi:hypothetical protein